MRSLLFIFLVFISTAVFGQISNVLVDKEINYPFLGSSPAINPKNTSNFIISTDANKIYVSLDSGLTWTKRIISTENGFLENSQLLIDRKGKMYLICQVSNANDKTMVNNPISTFISTDEGMNWRPSGVIDQTSNYKISEFNASINITSGDIYVTWVQQGGDGIEEGISSVFFSRSSNGANWSKPVNIIHTLPTTPDESFYSPIPAPGPNGQVYVTWAKDEKVYMDRTYSKGKTWLRNDVAISDISSNGIFDVEDYTGRSGRVVSAMDLSRSSFNGSLYLAWSEAHKQDNGSDIFFIRSSNKGDSWSRPGRISLPTKDEDQFAPVITVDQTTGILYVAFLSRIETEGYLNDVFLAWSLDGGATFTQVKINKDPINTSGIENIRSVLGLYAFQGIVCPTWITKNGDKTELISSCGTYKDLGIK